MYFMPGSILTVPLLAAVSTSTGSLLLADLVFLAAASPVDDDDACSNIGRKQFNINLTVYTSIKFKIHGIHSYGGASFVIQQLVQSPPPLRIERLVLKLVWCM